MTREVLIDWTGAGGLTGVTVLHMNAELLPANQVTDTRAFLQSLVPYIATSTVAKVRAEGREFDPITGDLTGAWAAPASPQVVGEGSNGPVANASQGLIRWGTGTVVDGRFLKGRTFIPGMNVNQLSAGEVLITTQNAINALAQDFALDVELQIWHRPRAARAAGPGGIPAAVPARAGSVADVVTAQMWPEFAVLRKRR